MDLIKIENGIWKLQIGTPQRHTPVALRQFPVKQEELAALPQAQLPELVSEITCRQDRRGLRILLPMDSDEDIYGFGLQLRSMNQAGRKRMIRVNSDPVADTGEGHAPIPFYISTAGYGLFVDTFRHVEFYMGTNLEKGRSRDKKEVNQVHKEFSESALYALKRNRERRTVIIDFTYEWSYLFPEPEKLIGSLGKQGYKMNLWEHLFVYPAAPFYEELLPYAGDYEVWNGLVPDLASPEAVKLFADHHREAFVQKGILGFKLDECDNSDFNASNWSFPDVTQFPSGMDGEQMHAAIGGMYQKLIYQVFHDANKRTYSQVRASGALASPLPFVLYSDLYNHKQFIRGMVTSSFSGLLWAPEVRDCRNGNDLLRRMETIMFSAHAIYNCWRIPNPPLEAGGH